MPEFTRTDWYRFPLYYDIVYDVDSPLEADFVDAVLARHGRAADSPRARLLEPACGNGRLVVELARRGHVVTGFDASAEMLEFARQRIAPESADVRSRIAFHRGRMESFRPPGRYDLAYSLLSTFKYLLTERHAVAHLRHTAAALAPGGLFVIGLHLTSYGRRRNDREVWRGQRDGVRVTSEVVTEPANPRTRLEWLRNRLEVRRDGTRRVERLETRWQVRTYDAAQFESLLAKVPVLEPVACYDFAHNIEEPRALDDTQEDLVVVLRRR
jgi:SAM-dependent methyltransferase